MISVRPVVAMLSVGEIFGGIERHLLGMCEFFLRQGQRPLLVLFHDRELAAQARLLGVDPVILEGRSFDLFLPRRLARILSDNQVNLVHAHGYRAVVNASLARRHHPFSLVRTVHGLVEPENRFSVPWIKSHLYNGLEAFFSRRGDATVCYVTDDLRRRRERGTGDGGLTVHNGIDPVAQGDFPRPADLPEGRFHLVAVGRISPVKGLQTLLKSLARMDPDLPLTLNLIGQGPSTRELKELASDLELGQRVRFLGFKKNIYDYLFHADALVMPSWHEGLPYTILETMSVGTPILASRVGGLQEILHHGETALLLEPGDVEGWARAMTDLVAAPDQARELGEAGRRMQAERLTLEAMGHTYWNIYQEKLGQDGKP